MSQNDIALSAAFSLPAGDIARRLRPLVPERSEAVALLHKRRGRWRAFRWREVEAETERLRQALQQRGIGLGARIAVCGAFEPDLIIFALAALALGASLHPVTPAAHGETLTRALAAIAPTAAFVQGRRTIARWLAVTPPGAVPGSPVPLFTALPLAPHPGPWRVDPLWPENDTAADSVLRDWGKPLKEREVVWVDEGTEWAEGLAALVEVWLGGAAVGGNVVMAFPETGGSAARDRREVRPAALLVSAARRRALDEALRRRLPPPGSLGRRLYDAFATDPSARVGRLLKTRINHILGLPLGADLQAFAETGFLPVPTGAAVRAEGVAP